MSHDALRDESALLLRDCRHLDEALVFRPGSLTVSHGETDMDLNYRKAAFGDIGLLTKTRIEVLRAANGLPDDTDMAEIERRTYAYYRKALHDGTHTAYLVFDGDRLAGAGGISYYQVMPTCRNPDGNKAYIMNMYTRPEYRRQGIARRMLEILISDAKARGVGFITLEATQMGRPLYENAGFMPMKNEMILPEQSCRENTL